jgi:antitoxin HigA-1
LEPTKAPGESWTHVLIRSYGMLIMKTITEENAMRMRNPVHPGRFLRTEIIEAHDLSVTNAAKILRVSRPTLSSLLNAKAGLSGDMALRFEKAFGVDMDTLMRMQNSYDIAPNTQPREEDSRGAL